MNSKLSLVGWFTIVAIGGAVLATAGRYTLHSPTLTFTAAAVALIAISKLLGDATEQLVSYVGQNVAGLINVSLGNLAELIIIFVAVQRGLLELVRAGIVGSIVGNLLLVMGASIYVGTRRHGDMALKPPTVTLFIDQLFLVASTLLLPTMFESRIPPERHQLFSYVLSAMLVGVYMGYYWMSRKDARFDPIEEQIGKLNHRWSLKRSLGMLVACGVAAFMMSELLVGEIDHVGAGLGVSQAFLGYILLPLLGNVAEHFVALVAAHKKLTELSLAISVGSASQVGMIVAPAAVLFGVITNHPLTLNFAGLPIELLLISLVAAFVVLRDNAWHKSEGVMLLALYLGLATAFWFTR